MLIKLLLEESKRVSRDSLPAPVPLVAIAKIVMELATSPTRVLGYDFTPPHCRERVIEFLRRIGTAYKLDSMGINFEIHCANDMIEFVRLANWTTVCVFRLSNEPVETAMTPQLRRRWLLRAPTDWYCQQLDRLVGVAYLSFDPTPAAELRTSCLEFNKVVAAASLVLAQLDAPVGAVTVHAASL